MGGLRRQRRRKGERESEEKTEGEEETGGETTGEKPPRLEDVEGEPKTQEEKKSSHVESEQEA